MKRTRAKFGLKKWLVLALLAAAAALYFQRGGDFGFLAEGMNWARDTAGSVAADDERPGDSAGDEPCELRLAREGLELGGERVEREEAVAACERAGEAALSVTGDARYGEYERVKEALEAAGIDVTLR